MDPGKIKILTCSCETPVERRGKVTKHGWKNCYRCGKVIPFMRTVGAEKIRKIMPLLSAGARLEAEVRLGQVVPKMEIKLPDPPKLEDAFAELKEMLEK